MDLKTAVNETGADLAGGNANGQQHERKPLQGSEVASQTGPEEEACCQDFQVSKYLICGSVEILQSEKLDVVVEPVQH